MAIQLTANDGIHSSPTVARRIDDLHLSADGSKMAYTLGIGTSLANPEDVYVQDARGNSDTKVSRTPSSGGHGIRQGSLQFSTFPLEGSSGSKARTAAACPW